MADFVIAYLFYTSFGEVGRVMIKKDLFFWPLGPILRAMGGIPVDRTNATALVMSIMEEMNKGSFFKLAIAPEGTRKPVKRWKSGALRIAYDTGVPVYAGYFDWGTKRISCGQKFPLTGNANEDLKRLQQYYESLHLTGKHQKKYLTH